jgi:hypothetical protein
MQLKMFWCWLLVTGKNESLLQRFYPPNMAQLQTKWRDLK